MFGLTTTRRLRAELAAAKTETETMRRRAERAEEKAETAEYNRGQVLAQNARLEGELADARAAADSSQTASWRRRAREAEKRADRLQQRLDDACGLGGTTIEDSGPWQPGYQAPKQDAK